MGVSLLPFSIICASNDQESLSRILLASPCIAEGRCECIVQEGFKNVSQAYNEGREKASEDLLCFVHQDVALPRGWEERLSEQVAKVSAMDPDWGMLGCAGAAIRNGKKELIGHVYDVCTVLGGPEGLPARVDTLDEMVLICRKADAVFEEWMPNYHLIGAEICLRLRRDGRNVYAIDAYCHHNSAHQRLDAAFTAGCGFLYGKYPEMLPIATTSATLVREEGVCAFYQ